MATHVIVTRYPEPDFNSDVYGATHALSRYLVPVGRLFFAAIFLLAAPGHFTSGAIAHATAQGVPFAEILVPVSGVLALMGGLSVLLGYHIRFGAFLLIVFLIPVTLLMHKFWEATGTEAMVQQANFMKNLALLGGALLLTYFGAGPFSLDKKRLP